jgi:hypothetical protein
MNLTSILVEYFDLKSQGDVTIISGNPFDRPQYAPTMGSNESDIVAMSNIFENTILPIAKRTASKRIGSRGLLPSYQGVATGGSINTINLAVLFGETRAILGNITQINYDTASSLIGFTIQIVAGLGAGQTKTITAWTGTGLYEATVNINWTTNPDATSVYFLNPGPTQLPPFGPLPLDNVVFRDDNHRNFVRFAYPNGDKLFSSVVVGGKTPSPIDPTQRALLSLTTIVDPINPAGVSTRINIGMRSHGYETGDMIKISGMSEPLNGIGESHINEYHIAYVTDANNFHIILFHNVSSLDGGFSKVPSPTVGATVGTWNDVAFTGFVSATALTITSVESGIVQVGQVVTGTGITANSIIVSGGGNDWVLSESTTGTAAGTGSAPGTATLTLTAPNTFITGQVITSTGGTGSITTGTTIVTGGTGTVFTMSAAQTLTGVTVTGSISLSVTDTRLNGIEVHTLRFDRAKFRTWLKTHYFSGWHSCCSCRMGKPTDSMAVVDTRARVYNTKGLRVVDCSIFPVKPNANTQAPAYGIAQKIFELVSVEEYDQLL